MKKNIFIFLGILILLTSCKTKKNNDETIIPINELYTKGISLLERNKHVEAAKEFGTIFLQHPGNTITSQAELMQAYSLFLATEYEEAGDILELFIRLHPLHQDVAYAYYLRALCHYMQVSNAQLDQSITAEAKIALQEVISLFPNTKYAIDASLKIDLVNDHLAGYEMNVARHYLRLNNPISAINRLQKVINDYQTTSHTAEALYRLTICYSMLGLYDEAYKYAAILGYNYPNNKWHNYSHNFLANFKIDKMTEPK